jgi:hypothetical protein
MRRGCQLPAHYSKASNNGDDACIARGSRELNYNYLECMNGRRRDCEIPIESANAPPEALHVCSSELDTVLIPGE